MARMTDEQIAEFLTSEDHRGTMILAVSREARGPLCVPLAFTWSDGTFRFSTKQSRLHARAFMAAGRATITVHHEDYDGRQHERYVVAEGPVLFETTPAADGTDPFLTAILKPESMIAVIYD